MTLHTIFHKPIDRPIEGVIKADDEKSLRIEIDEYVLTNEIEKRLENFLDAYNNYEGANGVWVSGFFGSGKSHLLKMLALLLENRAIEGIPVIDSFLSKCSNAILQGGLKKAVGIPSKSILFNIDQKADVISKTQIDALLAVFVKVFDETCGYYGKQGYIAQFERDLDRRNQYDAFKTAYREITGSEWSKGREEAILESDNIAKAYAKASGDQGMAAQDILKKYRDQYKVSIEDFAEQINNYVEQQEPNFRLNFFVDEVGQYIADNVKLMTNLQTIAESLATKCCGRAWIIVTAQEDMDTVVGEQGQHQSNDFSKIQARFANRMKLTSQDVAEVIQKRLLTKTDEGSTLLARLYDEQANNFRTLFDFADGSQTYRNFKDCDHFVQSYPFIPYQFALFQAAIQNLSAHNAFEGKHSSVGERSMLGVFQQVAIEIREYNIGQLATFDLMFEGIRTALKSSIQKAVLQAERHLDSEFAIRLLKALFLVKYIKEFKATPRNLSVLMMDSFNYDVAKLRKQIESGLNLLEQQTYVQRTGELYEYLTDEEKDIEQEIKNTEIEASVIESELDKLIFDHSLKLKKIRCESSGHDYPFSKKIDDRFYGREYELTIHVITPFNEHAEDETTLCMQSMGLNELRVVMPPDERLLRDLELYLKTQKFIAQNYTRTQKEVVQAILTDKGNRNNQRYNELQQRVQSLLGKAKLIINGSRVDSNGEDPQKRIIKGFQQLITKAYPNLRMLRVSYTEKDIEKAVVQSGGMVSENLSEAEQEVFAAVNNNKTSGVRTTLRSLLDTFKSKPYGWYEAATLYMIASLCARGKFEVRIDGNLTDQNELLKILKNTKNHGNVILEPQIDFSSSQIRSLKEFFEDFFDTPPPIGEAKTLGEATGAAFAELIAELNAIDSRFPFYDTVQQAIATLNPTKGKPFSWYITDLLHQEDSLLDLKENAIDPIKTFINGPQQEIFTSASTFIKQQQDNFTYIQGDEPTEVQAILNDPRCYKSNSMQQLKALIEHLQKQISKQLEAERTQAKEAVDVLKTKLITVPEYQELSPDRQDEIVQLFSDFAGKVETHTLIPIIREEVRKFKEITYTRLLSRISEWAKSAQPQEGNGTTVPITNGNDPAAEPKPEYIPSTDIRIDFDKPYLSSQSDVESYVAVLRDTLLEKIKSGKRITIV